MKQLYESTLREKQLATFGRKMMDYSETASMAGLKNEEIRPYNDLSEVGYMLTQVSDRTVFNEHQQKVIDDFEKFEGSNLPQGGPCLRTTF
jgi:hypothetical protein